MALHPLYEQNRGVTAQEDRKRLDGIYQPGVVGQGDFLVTLASGLQVNIAAGQAYVRPSQITDQGMYPVWNDAQASLTHTVNSNANARIDQVVLRINDGQINGNSTDTATIEIVPGTPTSGAQVITPGGAGYLSGIGSVPSSAMRLAYVRVPGSSGSITSADIIDARTFARGAHRILRTFGVATDGTAHYSSPSSLASWGDLVAQGASPACSIATYLTGVYPIECTISAYGVTYAGTGQQFLAMRLAGPAGTNIFTEADMQNWSSPSVTSSSGSMNMRIIIPASSLSAGMWLLRGRGSGDGTRTAGFKNVEMKLHEIINSQIN